MRLINEDTVMEIIERVTNEAVEKKQPKYLIQPRIIAEIAGLPTIEAEPVKHGHWVNEGFLDMYCSNCDETPDSESGSCPMPTDFCPYCGARMNGGDE